LQEPLDGKRSASFGSGSSSTGKMMTAMDDDGRGAQWAIGAKAGARRDGQLEMEISSALVLAIEKKASRIFSLRKT
jgi:hypothetical protein